MDSKQIIYDLETTGVKHWENAVHQIAGIILINDVEKETFNLKVRPGDKAVIEDSALAVGKVTKEQIMAYPPISAVHSSLINIISKYVDRYNKKDKFHLIGYNNASFDNNFLRAFFTESGDPYFGSWFWSDTQDVMVLASEKLKKVRNTMENFKLHTVARMFGIEVDEEQQHDALYDVRLTLQIYNKITTT